MNNTFIEPTQKIRFSNEFISTLWRIARGLASGNHGVGLEEAYEILERVDPKVRLSDGRVVTVSFDPHKVQELVLAHKAWKRG